jgi:hypothetical protein
MKLGDADVLKTIGMKVVANCFSRSLHSLLQKDVQLSSLHTCQGAAAAELQFCHPEKVPTLESFWKPLCASLRNLLRCDVGVRMIQIASGEVIAQ